MTDTNNDDVAAAWEKFVGMEPLEARIADIVRRVVR